MFKTGEYKDLGTKGLWDTIKGFFNKGGEEATGESANVVENFFNVLRSKVQTSGNGLIKTFSGIWEKIKGGAQSLFNGSGSGGGIISTFVNGFNAIGNAISKSKIGSTILGGLSNVGTALVRGGGKLLAGAGKLIGAAGPALAAAGPYAIPIAAAGGLGIYGAAKNFKHQKEIWSNKEDGFGKKAIKSVATFFWDISPIGAIVNLCKDISGKSKKTAENTKDTADSSSETAENTKHSATNLTINATQIVSKEENATSAGNANTATKATIAGTADSATTSNGVKDYNDANRTIKIGFTGAGLTAENLGYIAGYTDNSNGTKIKDVSKDVLKSWIGLGNYLPLSGGTMSGALNFANDTWNHVGDDVQIGDHNTSGSFYVQGLNGPTNIKLKKKGDTSTGSGDSATITYDGGNLVIDKTIQANLSGNASTATKAVSADKATSASSADKAAKLATARTVSGGSDITLSFNYDGSGNSTANIGFYSCKHDVSNTNNYPFHRFARLAANKGAWVDNSMTFLINQDYSGGGYGICRLVYRSNADSGSASVAAEWLVRKGLSSDTVQVAIKTDKTNGAYCDAFYKSSGTYMCVVIRAIASGDRANSGRTWTLVNSNEVGGTTATDKKTSSECWETIADAGTALHKQAYSASGPAKDEGYVASAGSANTSSSCAGNSASATKLTSSAGSATQPVYFKDGKPVAGTYTLGDASSKMVRTLSAQGNSGWTNKTTDDKYVPTMSFMAYWNGAYGGTSSNLQYCDRGRFGTIVTKNSGDYAAASHTHNYAGSGSAGGSANSAVKLDSSAGSAIQPVYFKDGKPVATTYALNKTVPADAKFTDTNTWRGIQNNLTSDSTDQSLSAAQGKALKTLVDGKAPASHKHTKSQITDFPTSMPASDVSAWAKAATKPSYTKAEVGLSNVDNTADKDKSVKYAASAGSASQLNGFTIQASTSDLTAGYSRLNNNVIYIVYE